MLSRSIDTVCHTKLSWHYNAIKVGLACGQLQPGTTLISRNIFNNKILINRNMKSKNVNCDDKLGWINLLLLLHKRMLHFYMDDDGIFCKCSWQLRIFNPSFPLFSRNLETAYSALLHAWCIGFYVSDFTFYLHATILPQGRWN